MMNLGVTDRGIDGLPLLPQYHFDLGIAPKHSWGDIGLGLDLLLDSQSRELSVGRDPWRFVSLRHS